MPASRGETARLVDKAGHVYAANIRLITLLVIVPTAIFAAENGPTLHAATIVMILLASWSTIYIVMIRRRIIRLATILDCAALSAMALATSIIVPAEWLASGKTWLVHFTAFAAVGYQFSTQLAVGSTAAAALACALVIGTSTALPMGGTPATIITSAWTLIIAGLARLMWTLVQRGGLSADQAIAEVERARRDLAVADAVRRDQRHFFAALHDTVAATLLMIGLGEVTDRKRLVARAQRDIAVLNSSVTDLPTVDLSSELRNAVEFLPIKVRLLGLRPLGLRGRDAAAIVGAVTEAINNAARYAKTAEVEVVVDSQDGALRIRVVDEGVGFDPADVGPAQRGLRESIFARMEQIGGYAQIESKPGGGTIITLGLLG